MKIPPVFLRSLRALRSLHSLRTLRASVAPALALALACPLLILAGCGKLDTTGGGKPSSSGAPSGGGGGQSSIAFYNNFLGFRGVSQSIFKDLGETLVTCEKAVDENSGSGRLAWDKIIPPNSQIPKIPDYEFAAPKDFSSANKNYINPRIQSVREDVAALLKEVEAMRAYHKAEDYKDDWYKKFLMAKPRIEALMERIAKNNKEVYKLADTLSEEIDRKNVAKSPVGVFILNMRYMIDKARDRADLILDNNLRDLRYGLGVTDDERRQMIAKVTTICDQLDALTKELDSMSAKYKTADKKIIKGTTAEKVYDGFFDSYEKSGEDMRRIIRDLRERGYTNEQHNVERVLQDLAAAHNNFLKAVQSK